MQAPQHPLAGARHVVLDERPRNADFGVALGVEKLGEKAALVAETLGCQNNQTRNRQLGLLPCVEMLFKCFGSMTTFRPQV